MRPLKRLGSLGSILTALAFGLGVLAASGCSSTASTAGTCMSNAECVGNTAGTVCNPEAKKCVTCYIDSNCAPGQKCEVAKNRCVACLANKDCLPGNLCVDGKCLTGCDASAPCPTGKVCKTSGGTSVCVDCITTADCKSGRCDTTGNVCVECLQDTDCAPGSVCRANKCTAGCSSQQVCAAPKVCDLSSGTCVDCTTDADCKNTAAPRCDVKTNKCVECLTGNDNCPLGKYCASNQCYTGCRNDNDCKVGNPSPASQGKAKCLVAKNACVACLAPSDCPQGYICAQDNTCTMGCINDSNCGAGQSCCNGQCQAINTKTNCGTCGNACGSGEDCCGNQCIKVSTTQNCGGCGIACNAGQTCCASGCATLLTDANNCGACGNACAAGQICCAGSCRNPNMPGNCVDCTKTCSNYEIKGTGFSTGTADQLKVTQDGLTTVPAADNPPPAKSPFVYIAMHDSNTVNQVDANTGVVVRNIRSGGGNPSRGAQALDGSYWVAHRGQNCNVNDPACSNVSQLLPDGSQGCLVGRAADGAVMPFVRALAIDKFGYVWAGSWNDMRLHKIDPNTCKTILDVPMNKSGFQSYPYGLAVDSKGIMWNSNINTGNGWIGVDTNDGTIKYTVASNGYCSYGVVIDRQDNVWFGQCGSCNGGAFRIDGATRLFSSAAGNNGRCSNGITLDTDGNIHIAQPGSPSVVTKLKGGSGALMSTFTFSGITNGYGIAGDTYGNVWYPGYSNNQVVRYDRNTGAVAFTTPLQGSTPYTYSDWNGIVIRTVTSNNAQAGTWALAFDGGTPTTIWSSASWSATTPKGTSVKFRFRAAPSFGGLATAQICGPFLTSPADLTTCNFGAKQWLQVNIEMTTGDVTVQPVINSFKIFFQPN